jgi:HSP20 family protein
MARHPWLGPAWDPSGDVVVLQQEMNRLFEALLGLVPGSSLGAGVAWAPPMDVCDGPTAMRVLVELPGLTQEQIGIETTQGMLRIKGDRPPDPHIAREQLIRLERRCGAFARSLPLPAGVDAEGIRATYRDGVLEIRIPKRPEATPRIIAVESP